jgi:hypothetical protein
MPFHAIRDARAFLLYHIPANRKDHFLRFVTEGEKDAQGNFVIDPDTRLPMTGVIDWARSFRLFDTRFYTRENADGSLFFIATAVRTLPEEVLPDWATIPGFVRLFGPNNEMRIRDDLNALVEP